ncbi:MAG TPA: amino acid adenylation domain-containing protein [Thermoanaerobaculia bacterium]|jgi:amino acid adenylation domain-containing protein
MKPNQIATTSSSIVEILQARAAGTPERIAYRFLSHASSSEETLTYAELDAAARRIGAHLQSFTMPGDRALLLYRPGLEFIQGFLGCLYAGVIAVPAYPPHPTRPARDLPKLRGIAADARPAAILTSMTVIESCESLFVEAPDLRAMRWIATDALPLGETELSPPIADAGQLAFLQYTSGSTGLPKGVMVSHANLMHNEQAIATLFDADAESTIVGWLPMYHDMGLIGTMLHGIYTGAACVLMSPMEFLEQPLRWLEAITKFHAHTSGGPNFAYDLCVRRISGEQKAGLDLSSWRIAFNGAEPVRSATLARFAEAFAPAGFRASAFFPCYGLAEATLAVTGGAKADEPIVRELADAKLVGCGVSVEGQRVVIVDPETREPRADGETGEIWVSGPSVARGYWEKPEQSEQTFAARIAGTNDGPFLRTGDLGCLDGGELFVNGRRKDLIIIRGLNHYPHDLEQTVEQTHPALRVGCGAAFSIDVDGEERLVAVQEVDRANRLQASDEVAESIRRRIAEEHEVPLHALVLIKTGTIPKTTSGKIQRGLTKQMFLDGTLAVISEWIWKTGDRACLSLERFADLDPQTSLFSLGLDSLQLFELKNAIERERGVELRLTDFMDDATLATLTAAIEAARVATPIARTTGDQPLSHGQQRLWFFEQLAPGASYNETLAMRLDGALDVQALDDAVNAIVARHEALRTTFVIVDGKPVQRRAESPRIELTKIAATDAERSIAAIAAQPFDLARGPLLRATLVATAPGQHVFAITVHHIVGDGWSTGIFLRELAAAYAGETLVPLPVQYADHAAWLRTRLDGGVLAEQLTYWRNALAGAPTALALPLDRPRPAVQTMHGATQRFVVPRELATSLRQIASTENATLFMTLLAAFNILLHRYTGQDDILVGSPVAGRNCAEAEGLIGFFVNTLVLRGDLSGNPAFRDVVARVKKTATGAYANQELPFELLVDELKPERTLTHTPLFQAAFALQQPQARSFALGAVHGELLAFDSGAAKFDLALSMEESADGIAGTLEYNSDCFDATTIARMIAHFEQLLTRVAGDPSLSLSAIELLSAEERERMLVEWNDTARPVADVTVLDLFREQVRLRPDAQALSFAGASLTYADLSERVDTLAAQLRGQGAAPEVLIAIRMERGIDAIVSVLAVLASGAAYLPLDPALPEERLQFILDDAKPLMVLSDGQAIQPLRARADRQESQDSHSSSALAYVIYTSGSTGRPKGVLVEHRGLTNFITAFADIMQLTPESRVLQFASLSFDASVEEIFTALTTGACLVLAKREDLMPVEPFVSIVNRERITTALLPPSVLALLDPAVMPTLQSIASGGEACSAALASKWSAHVRFVNAYGPTEITVAATADVDTDGLSIGRPIANVTAYVLGPGGQPALPGVAGELCIGGAGVARGYHGRPELTAERFIANPFGEGRLYRTGDRARFRADGRVEFLGRLDDQVKLRGFRIELGEIEATLERHPSVVDAHVILRDEQRLVAYVVTSKEVAANELREFTARSLPDYMVPSAVIALERFPVTAHGKIDVKALPSPEAQRGAVKAPRTPLERQLAALWCEVLGLAVVGIDDDFFALGGHSLMATQLVSRINVLYSIDLPLRRVLETPTVADLAVVVAAQQAEEQERLKATMAKDPVQQRIAQLSPEKRELLLRTLRTRKAQEEAPSKIVARKREPNEALASFAQQRLWFLWQLEPESAAYNMPGALRLRGPLDYDALRRCFDEIVRRHDTLRTTFRENAQQQPMQVIGAPGAGMALQRISLTHLPEAEREAEAARLASVEGHTPFDLSRGPLFRATVIDLGPDDHALLLTMHHVISDGWSVGILVREIVALYDSEQRGLPSPLAELDVQYADFSEWQREFLSGETLERYWRYWLDHLGNQVTELELQTDFPRPTQFTDHGAMVLGVIDKELTTKLKAFCQQERLTLFPLLLAGIQTVLHCHTGTEKVVIGTDVANRNRAETESIIGFFVNQLVLQTDFAGNPPMRQVVRRAWDTALGAYAHQDFPFDFLVKKLNPKRDPSRMPLFTVKFVLQNAPATLLSLTDLTIAPLLYDNTTAKFDLLFSIQEEEGTLVNVVTYKTDLFKPATIARVMRHLEFTLTTFVDEPELALDLFREKLAEHERAYQKARQNEFKEASRRKLKLNTQSKEKAVTA